MHDGDDYDRLFLNTIVDAKRKPADQCSARTAANRRIHRGMLPHRGDGEQHLIEKLFTEPLLLPFVPTRRHLDILLSFAAKPNRKGHSRFRMSASAISASRPGSPSTS